MIRGAGKGMGAGEAGEAGVGGGGSTPPLQTQEPREAREPAAKAALLVELTSGEKVRAEMVMVVPGQGNRTELACFDCAGGRSPRYVPLDQVKAIALGRCE